MRLHQIDAGHLLGHGVFDLQPGVGFHEGERRLVAVGTVGIDEKLERAQAGVADVLRQADRGLAQPFADRGGQPRRGRHFDELLIAALQAALALAQMRHGAGPVADDLHLDVPRPRNEPLDIHVAIAERGLCLGPTPGVGRLNVVADVDGPHAASPTACHGLDHHRRAIAERVEKLGRRL